MSAFHGSIATGQQDRWSTIELLEQAFGDSKALARRDDWVDVRAEDVPSDRYAASAVACIELHGPGGYLFVLLPLPPFGPGWLCR